ncbi:hypothetical protein Sm713_67590 [Streptomyces sp. TS71-3]|nr:hypothetical protein Sm713_67590 [Streptomyces sp. TS71-3]
MGARVCVLGVPPTPFRQWGRLRRVGATCRDRLVGLGPGLPRGAGNCAISPHRQVVRQATVRGWAWWPSPTA